MPAAVNSIAGKDGSVKVDNVAVAAVTKWELDEEIKVSEMVHSDSGGRVDRFVGAQDCKGTFEAVLDRDSPWLNQFVVGSEVDLDLIHTTGIQYDVHALILTTKVGSDINDSAKPVMVACTWGGKIQASGSSFTRPTIV